VPFAELLLVLVLEQQQVSCNSSQLTCRSERIIIMFGTRLLRGRSYAFARYAKPIYDTRIYVQQQKSEAISK